MRKNIQNIIVILLPLLLLSPTVHGQEFTKVITLPKSQDMIVRDYAGNVWVVYDKYLATTDLASAFLLVSETGATAPMLTLPPVKTVKDFEIYGDDVFFCGQDTNSRAVLGRFSLQGFPQSEVCIWTIPEMYSFNKLDVKEINHTLHVMMTGEAALGSYHIIDAWQQFPVQWSFNISKVIDGWQFDDVVITSSDVIFSALRRKDNRGTLIKFYHPGMSQSILPSMSTPYYVLPSGSNILLKATPTANYVFLTNTASGGIAGEALGLSISWSKTFGTLWTTYPIVGRDLAFHPQTGRMDVLSVGVPGTAACMLHLFGSATPTMIDGHSVMLNDIFSVDDIASVSGTFIAAGVSVTLDFLTLYRYKYDRWEDCFEEDSIGYGYPITGSEFGKMDIFYRHFSISAECGYGEAGVANVFTECPSKE